MRYFASIILLSAIFSTAALAQTETPVPVVKSPPPTMTAVQPVNPVSTKPGGPVIQSITAQLPDTGPLLVNRLLSTQFHFVAPNGNAVLLHREVATTSANNINLSPNQAINIPPDAQKQGGGGDGQLELQRQCLLRDFPSLRHGCPGHPQQRSTVHRPLQRGVTPGSSPA